MIVVFVLGSVVLSSVGAGVVSVSLLCRLCCCQCPCCSKKGKKLTIFGIASPIPEEKSIINIERESFDSIVGIGCLEVVVGIDRTYRLLLSRWSLNSL